MSKRTDSDESNSGEGGSALTNFMTSRMTVGGITMREEEDKKSGEQSRYDA